MVPELPPPPPLPPLLPQPLAALITTMAASTLNSILQARRRAGIPKNKTIARAAPPAGTKNLFSGFSSALLVAAVVLTVTVEVCAVVPLIVTEAGDNEQVGASLGLAIVVVTAQLRLTVPV